MKATYRRPWIADYQRDAIFAPERYALIEATTKAGKTAGCLIWLAEQAFAGKDGRNYWWVAPVYDQANIAYSRMKRGLPKQLYGKNDSERRIVLANGAVIWFKSGEKPDNLYGEDVYAAVVDEASRVREEAWDALRSTLTATKGPVRIIGNVKGRANWFYRMARDAEKGAEGMRYAKITSDDAIAAGILDRAEIEDAKRIYAPSKFRELYMAEPADIEGQVYKNWSAENIDEVGDTGGTVLIGMDFNVNPMCAVIGSKAGDQLHIWDEIQINNGNTVEMCEEIRERFPVKKDKQGKEKKRDIAIYPDPSGKARKTSAPIGQTDHSILSEYGFRVIAQRSAPAVVDRINEVNALICNAEGQRRLYVHPRCQNLIESFEMLVYKDGTSQPDKSMNIDHMTDAIGYLIHEEFPIDPFVMMTGIKSAA